MFHPHLKQLRAFAAVMRTGATKPAADILNLTQPAISMLVRDFETNVGFPLFKRAGGRLTPTAEAHVLMRHVSEALNGLDHLAGIADDIRNLRVGSLRCASLVAPSLVVVPRAIAALTRRYPGLRVSFQTRSSSTIWEWAHADIIDLGLVESEVDDGFRILENFDIECFVAVPNGHPLGREEVLTPQLLADQTLLTLAPNHPTTFQLRTAFTEQKLPFEPRHDSFLMGPIAAMVAEGVGVGLVEPFSLAGGLGQGRVVVRRFRPRISLRLSLIAPSERQQTRHVEEFIAILVDEIDRACGEAAAMADRAAPTAMI